MSPVRGGPAPARPSTHGGLEVDTGGVGLLGGALIDSQTLVWSSAALSSSSPSTSSALGFLVAEEEEAATAEEGIEEEGIEEEGSNRSSR